MVSAAKIMVSQRTLRAQFARGEPGRGVRRASRTADEFRGRVRGDTRREAWELPRLRRVSRLAPVRALAIFLMLANVRPRPMLPSLAANFLSETRALRMAQAMVMRGRHWSAI